MGNISNIFKIILAIAVLAGGCADRVRRSRDLADQRTGAEHRFEPLDFYGDDAVITGQGRFLDKQIKPDSGRVAMRHANLDDATVDTAAINEPFQPSVIFRIQVFASKSFDEAQEFARQIEPLFVDGVFVEYQMPYYKVRVGEFYYPEDGEIFLEDVKQMGFKNAWLVRVIK
jgi:hypothetical protein